MAEPGHNLPDPSPDLLKRLPQDYANLQALVGEFDEAIKAVKEITSRAEYNATDMLAGRIRARRQEIEETREIEKSPFLKGGKAVDSFFIPIRDALDRYADICRVRNKAYLIKLDEEEKAKRRAEEAEARRLAGEHQARAAAAAAMAARAKDAEIAARYTKAAATATKAAEELNDAAGRSAEAILTQPATRLHTEAGVSSLRKVWTFEAPDLSKVPLEQLRPYLKDETITQAIRMAVADGVRTLEGVRIFEDSALVSRRR